MKAVVFTLGCKVNSYESNVLLAGLKNAGYDVSEELEYADLYILNTCAVTKEAEKKSRQAISRILTCNPNARIIVTGCASQNNPESFIDKKGVYLVTGAMNKERLLSLIDSEGIIIDKGLSCQDGLMPLNLSRSRSYIKVEDGCNNFCSYCLIPYLRGRCRSRSIESIKAELDHVTSDEVVITGINLSAYNYGGKDLADLIASLSDYPFRIRLSSLEESIVSQKLLIAAKGLRNFAPHFHLSLQSGSDKVLSDMNRHYDRDRFMQSVNDIRSYFPDAAITTDIIVGFPTETDEDFEKTIDLCSKVAFADIHCFVFSPREGTKAFSMNKLDKSVVDARMHRLLDVKQQSKTHFVSRFTSEVLSVLIEEEKGEMSVGYSANYIRCYVRESGLEGFVNLRVLRPYLDGALCEIV